MKILVVDDKADITYLVQTILELEGYEVVTVSNGYDAAKACDKDHFPIIFLDLMMEGKDGFATLIDIRKTEKNKESFIVALTAKAYDTDKKEVLLRGFNDHFSKPFRSSELTLKVKNVMKTLGLEN